MKWRPTTCAIVSTQLGPFWSGIITAHRSRAHIVVSEDLLREVDALVGPRHRSEFFAEAVGEKIAHVKLQRAAERLGGSLADTDIPGWGTSKSAADWVRGLRREDEESEPEHGEPPP
jgi:hypothetical protein